METIRQVEPAVLAFVSSWEATAILTRKVPTITSVVMRLPRLARCGLVAATAFWLMEHFDIRG